MKKNNLLPIFIFLLLIASFWFAPKITTQGLPYFTLNAHLRMVVLTDNSTYLGAAILPKRLWNEKELRQSRPLYIWMGAVACRVVYYLSYPFHTWIETKTQPYYEHIIAKMVGDKPPSDDTKAIIPMLLYAYVGYLIINALLVFLALYFFRKIIELLNPPLVKSSLFYILLSFLLSNEVMKFLFWQAHQQMFTLFSPIFTVYIALTWRKKGIKELFLLAFMAGVLLLVYGNFFILVFICAYLVWQNAKEISILVRTMHVVLALAFSALPTLCWIGLLKSHGVTYFNVEMENFNQIVWIFQTLSVSFETFMTALYRNLLEFSTTLRAIFFPCLAFLSILSCFFYTEKNYWGIVKARLTQNKTNIRLIVLVLLLHVCSLALLGYYQTRLTFNVVPIILILVSSIVSPITVKQRLFWVILSLFCFWHIYTLFFYETLI